MLIQCGARDNTVGVDGVDGGNVEGEERLVHVLVGVSLIVPAISDLGEEDHDRLRRVIGLAHFLFVPHEIDGGDASIRVVQVRKDVKDCTLLIQCGTRDDTAGVDRVNGGDDEGEERLVYIIVGNLSDLTLTEKSDQAAHVGGRRPMWSRPPDRQVLVG